MKYMGREKVSYVARYKPCIEDNGFELEIASDANVLGLH